MIWNEAYTKHQRHIEPGKVVSITGRLDLREEGPRVAADKIELLSKPTPKEKPLVLTLDSSRATEDDLVVIRDLIWKNPGKRTVILRIQTKSGKTVRLQPNADFLISMTPEVSERLKPWMG
jgi:DNA polymerase-3 subunit alpha